MSIYQITIRAMITKTIEVEAEDREQAEIEAHESFSVLNNSNDESYEQDTLEIIEVIE